MPAATRPKKIDTKRLPGFQKIFVCYCCGKEYSKQETNFFKRSSSPFWESNNGFFPVCRSCCEKIYEELVTRHGEKNALHIMCHYLDLPFREKMYTDMSALGKVELGKFIRATGMKSINKTYVDFLLEKDMVKPGEEDAREEPTTKLNPTERQNKAYCIQTVGYDPFAGANFTDEDRRYCFNVLAGYCDADGVSEDGHKLQCVVEMTIMHLQNKKMDDEINQELRLAAPNEGRIAKLTSAKTSVLSSITKMAQDNNISSQYNKNKRYGQGTMSDKIKEIADSGFEAIKVNLFDIKTCDAMRQIADLSNASLIEQLSLDENDYISIIKEQRESVQELSGKVDRLSEENRQLSNMIADFKKKGR